MKKTMLVILFEAVALAAVALHGAWNELLPVPKSIAYTGGEVDATALERVTVRKAAVKTAPKATADEAALTIVKLLEMPEYLTGEVIKVDGGWI